MHCCGLIQPLKSIIAEPSCQEVLESFSFSPWCMFHELEEVGGGDRAVSGCLQLSPSPDVLSFVPRCHLNLHLQCQDASMASCSNILPWPGSACGGGNMGYWGITQWSHSGFVRKESRLPTAEQITS